jgi:hypothetical protein
MDFKLQKFWNSYEVLCRFKSLVKKAPNYHLVVYLGFQEFHFLLSLIHQEWPNLPFSMPLLINPKEIKNNIKKYFFKDYLSFFLSIGSNVLFNFCVLMIIDSMTFLSN